ncbi:hypothetical protein BH23CHL2_BH23CHL2_32120 [soil metagenome]
MELFLPYFEDYGILLGLTGVLLLVRREAQRRFGDSHLVAEASLIYAAYFCYYLVRGLVKDQVATARVNAHRIVDLERDLRMFVEPQAQGLTLRHDWLVDVMNWVYVWFHWPVIAIVFIWLFFNHPPDYTLYRNAILISGALSLLVFTFFPVAPPRFMPEFGFVDTIEQRSFSKHVLLPPGLANKYAAVPSLHAGWNLLMAIAIVRKSGTRSVQAAGFVIPIMMALSIVLTGNHYILDAVAGYFVALTGLYLAARYFSDMPRTEPRPPTRPPEIAVPSS